GTLGTGAVTNNAALAFNRSDDVTVSNVISGTGSVTQAGAGTTTLSGANSYDGVTNVNAGTLLITNGSALGSTVGGTVVAAGATLAVQGGISVGAEGLTLSGAGGGGNGALRNVSGTNLWGGTVTLAGNATIGVVGALRLEGVDGAFDLTKVGTGNLALTQASSYGATTISGGILQVGAGGTTGTLGTGAVTNNATLSFVRSNALTVSNAISGTGEVRQVGSGNTTLTGANSYSGVTQVTAGTLTVGNATALGTAAGGTTVADGATLALDGGAGLTVTGEALTLNGAGVASGGALRNVSGDNTWTGAVTLGSAASIRSEGGSLTLSGNVANGGFGLTLTGSEGGRITGIISGSGTLEKSLTGTWALAGNNTYAGLTTVNGGTLVLEGGQAIADTATVFVNGGTLELAADETVGDLTSNAGTIALGTNTVTIAADNSASSLNGTVTGGAGSGILQNATGTQSRRAPPTMADGTITVNAGTLVLTNGGNSIGEIIVAGSTPTAATLRIGATGAAGGATGQIRTTGSIIDYADGVDNATPITIESNTTRVQVLAGTATQSGEIGEDVAPRPLEKIGDGTLIMTAANTYTGVTTVSAGTLALGNAGAVSNTASTLVASGATLRLDTSANVGALGNVGGTGGTVNLQANTITLGGASLSDSFAGVITGTGGLIKGGTGTQTLTGTNTYSGSTTINGGILQIGAGGTSGTLGTGGVAVNSPGSLTFNRTNTLTAANVFTGDGTINQSGTGTTVLTGASGAFAGTTNVNAGALRLDGTLGSAGSQLFVNSGGTLQGSGTVGGSAQVESGGTLAAGDGVGDAGQLAIGGALTLEAGSTTRFDLGAPNLNSGVDSDRINVGGLLTLGGTLAVDSAAADGYYRLFNATGGVTGTFASSPGGATVLTNVTNQVNLRVGATAPVQFWDGANFTDNNAVDGGAGTWNATNTNWTISNGQFNDGWLSGEGVFQGAAGTVTIDGAQSFQGLTFSTAGYILNGPGTLVSPTGGGFSNLVADADATINAAITGAGGINKSGAGNLTLGGVNTYAGITDVAAGTLTINGSLTASATEVAAAGTLVNNGTVQGVTNAGTFDNNAGATAGAVTNSGTATNDGTVASLSNTAGTFTNTGAITGTAGVTGGTLDNQATGTVGGLTTIGGAGTVTNAGTMAGVTNAGSFDNSGSAGALTNTGTATNSGTLASVANNAGTFTSNAGTVTGATTNSAAMDINGGTFTGGITNNAGGTIDAEGNITANIQNAGTFSTTAGGLTEVGGSTFTNTGTANIVAGGYTGLGTFANNAGTTTVTGQTLGATSITNAATMNVTDGTLDGAFGNTGTANFAGTSSVTGLTTNSSVMNMAGGATTTLGGVTNNGTMNLNLAGDTTVAGAFGGSGTVDMFGGAASGDHTLTFTGAAGSVGAHNWLMNYTAAGVGDTIVAAGGQFGGGLQNFAFDLAGDFALGTEAVVVQGQTGLNRDFTVQGAALGGTVVYSLADIGGDTRLVAEANPGFGGIASGVSLTQALIANVVNRPSSPFASGLVTEQGCSRGGYARGVFGRSDASGTSNNGISTRTNNLSASYAGAQGGFDVERRSRRDRRLQHGQDRPAGVRPGRHHDPDLDHQGRFLAALPGLLCRRQP
ncbi:MAG TPA: autotransporter-associated beta strand repeat-containing protein, partial [Paracoccaceae bacterium]|nr:autotransporter-associated beta strand repeat-containing protein [Paracoccaceae bacterium]